MAHFAKIDENNLVQQVIVVSNEDCGNLEFPESEPIGQAFIASLGLGGLWLQCSYHASFRGCWPNAGFTYDPNLDEFAPPIKLEPVE
jgi:hypothetical protein